MSKIFTRLKKFFALKKNTKASQNKASTNNPVPTEISTETHKANENGTFEPDTKDYNAPLQELYRQSNQDKEILDLVTAVEQIIRNKNNTDMNLQELKDRFSSAQEQIEFLKKEIDEYKQYSLDKEKEIESLQGKVDEKNMKIDQLLEDYSKMQTAMSGNIAELKNLIEFEREKNKKLQQQIEKDSIDYVVRLKKQEEAIMLLETENRSLREQYETIRQENTYLVNIVSDFTNRITVSCRKPNSDNAESNSNV